MLDFKRIGGEIISSPLNENFRKLRNDISISNTNLVFSETDAVKETITDMMAIENPDNAQVCYVISSGELYRYAIHDKEWHKIADFGQTFRQGFLNSGAVVLEDYITLKEETNNILIIPSMLVYFKNQPGDNRYLKGMYLFTERELNVDGFIESPGAYSIFIQSDGECAIDTGLPQVDNPNKIYLGTFLIGSTGILQDFIYTLPDMAYTADRGFFLLYGGTASGSNLAPNKDLKSNKINRNSGYYYDEGINFPIGLTDNFPVDTDNGANFDLKSLSFESPVSKIYYMIPDNPLTHNIDIVDGLINNKYWDGENIADVPEGFFTIQKHLVTPSGQNIILYGTDLYNSINDGVSNLNSTSAITLNFPYMEATRIVIGNTVDTFDCSNDMMCRFFTLGHLAQVGTVVPEFADNLFKLYSGDDEDNTPAFVQISLSELANEDYHNIYTLNVLPYTTTQELFGLTQKHITSGVEPEVDNEKDYLRKIGTVEGYRIADNADLEILQNRIRDIEKEIWEIEKAAGTSIYNQSIRYRLTSAESRMDAHDIKLQEHTESITDLFQNKVNKATTINSYKLGDTTNENEAKNIVLVTDDIQEKDINAVNKWFTQDRVKENEWVIAAKEHYDSISAEGNAEDHVSVNPHNLSTDDIKYLSGTTKVFVAPDEAARINASKLPDDTIKALADLDAKNMDHIAVSKIEGNSTSSTGEITNIGNVTSIRFYEDGVNLNTTSDGTTLVVECKGQVDEDTVMLRNIYARQEMQDPTNPELVGAVDKALTAFAAYGIHGIASAGADKYYGTDEEGTPGIYDIQKFVTTAEAKDFTDIDQIAYVPLAGSVQEKHLEESLLNKINNNFHTVYSDGTLISESVNAINFGDNLDVHMDGNILTVNASGEGGSGGVTNFANLEDVSVIYTGNAGKTLVINETEDGVVVTDSPSLDEYMLESVYVDTNDVTKVRKAVQADNATLAATATNALAVNTKVVDDTKTTDGALWTASKIISNTSSQISNEGVNTYSGTTVPSNSLGKDGDLYILIES